MHIAEPEAQKGIDDLIEAPLALLGLRLGDRHLATHQLHALQDVQIARRGRGAAQARRLADAAQSGVPLGDGTQHREIVARLAQLLHKEQLRLVVEQPALVQDLSVEVVPEVDCIVKGRQVVGHPAQHRPDLELLHRRVAREEKGRSGQRQGRQQGAAGASAVERRAIAQHLALHHADIRAAQDQQHLGVAQRLVPHLLQDRGHRLVAAHEIGELIQRHHGAPRQIGQGAQGGLPRGESEPLRGLVVGVAPDRLRESSQLIGVGAERGHEKEVRLVAAKGLQELGLAHAPAAIQHEQLGAAGAIQVLELAQFSLAIDEHRTPPLHEINNNHDYYNRHSHIVNQARWPLCQNRGALPKGRALFSKGRSATSRLGCRDLLTAPCGLRSVPVAFLHCIALTT